MHLSSNVKWWHSRLVKNGNDDEDDGVLLFQTLKNVGLMYEKIEKITSFSIFKISKQSIEDVSAV